jgi:hypothetical protein
MSKNYGLWVKQAQEGCDYSISCGETVYALNASTLDEAISKSYRIMFGVMDEEGNLEEAGIDHADWKDYEEPELNGLEWATLIDLTDAVNILASGRKWYKDEKEFRIKSLDSKILADEEARELAELARLKAKWENSQ